jgi:hypothetical protein
MTTTNNPISGESGEMIGERGKNTPDLVGLEDKTKKLL